MNGREEKEGEDEIQKITVTEVRVENIKIDIEERVEIKEKKEKKNILIDMRGVGKEKEIEVEKEIEKEVEKKIEKEIRKEKEKRKKKKKGKDIKIKTGKMIDSIKKGVGKKIGNIKTIEDLINLIEMIKMK